MEFLLVLVLIASIMQLGVMIKQLKELRECRRQLKSIALLTRDTRSSQGSIGIRQSGGVKPEVPRAKQMGHRDDVPATGRMRTGLKFTRKGGEYERNRDTEGD